jgi:predicted ATP-grasp superfamily ATP-dependent carboligase
MIKVTLLDGQIIQAISIAKQLKKSGFYVILLCDSKFSYGYNTKYCDRKIICPSIKDNLDVFHIFLLNFLKTHTIDVLIPMNDNSAEYLSKYKNQLSHFSNFIIPDYDIFVKGYNKNELMKVCKKLNISHPKSLDLNEKYDIHKVEEIGFPALIKPNETTGARGFAIIDNFQELQNQLPKIIRQYGQCHLQEFIPIGGDQFKVQLMIYNGAIINSTVLRKERFYPMKGGSSCFNKTIIRDDLVELCFEVLQAIEWEGFADFDLIEDPKSNQCKIMEINPRVPACIKASFISGVDFANLIVEASMKKKLTKYEYTPDKCLRYLGMDLLWLLSSKEKIKNFKPWIKGWFSKNHFFQDFSKDDPMPFIYGTLASFLKQLNPDFREAKRQMNK